MSLSSSPSPLPKFPFLIADAAFLAAAWYIADQARHPLGSSALIGVVVCVVAAAVCGVIPFLTDYARRQDEALDDRQRSLEALSRTVATAAEQISIAAGGLHEVAALAQRNLSEAQRLPQVLAEQISELEAKFGASREDDREELERELSMLRASESERLEATAQKIARAAADWARAESSGLRHVVAAKTFIAELEQKTATLKAVLSGAPVAAGAPALPSVVKDSSPPAGAAAAGAFPTAVNEASPGAGVAEQAAAEADAPRVSAARKRRGGAIDMLVAAAAGPLPTSMNVAPPPPADPNSSGGLVAEASRAFGLGARTGTKPLEGSATNPPDEVGHANGDQAVDLAGEAETQRSDDFEAYGVTEATLTSAKDEPAGSADEPRRAADTDHSLRRGKAAAAAASGSLVRNEPVEADHADIEETPPPAPEAAVEPAPAARPRRVAKKPLVEQETIPGLDLPDDTAQMFPEETAPAAANSADGSTRLIVTAYIGIGNRLFIRGEGPGLSWDEGVPLQFVSIGKWRWETPNATGTVRFKLYKNDREECSTLAVDRVEAGQQQELKATF